jgi:hypothetical protein
VCRFHVAAGEKLQADKQFIWRPCPECHEASQHHLLKFGFFLLVWFNLGFTTKGRLATVLIIPSSWGSQRAVLTRHQRSPASFMSFVGEFFLLIAIGFAPNETFLLYWYIMEAKVEFLWKHILLQTKHFFAPLILYGRKSRIWKVNLDTGCTLEAGDPGEISPGGRPALPKYNSRRYFFIHSFFIVIKLLS